MRVLAIGGLLLVACSSGEPASPAATSSEQTPEPKPTAAANAPEKEADPVPEQTPPSNPGSAVGEQATPFSLRDDSGTEVSLDQFRDQRAVLLAFYPKDFTGG